MEKDKYVKWKHVSELLKLIKERDQYMDWTKYYEEADKKVKNTIEWLERNAKEIEPTIVVTKEQAKLIKLLPKNTSDWKLIWVKHLLKQDLDLKTIARIIEGEKYEVEN